MADGVRQRYRDAQRDAVVALGDARVFWAVIVIWLATSALARNVEGWLGLLVTVVTGTIAVSVVLAFRRRQPPR